MPYVDIPKYIELYKKRNKLKLAIDNSIGKSFYNLLRDYETEVGNIFASTDPLTITAGDFRNAIDSFINELNYDSSNMQDAGRDKLIDINNAIKDSLAFQYPIDYSILPQVNQSSEPTIREMQGILDRYRDGQFTETRARRLVQDRLRVPLSVSKTIINTQLAGFDNTAAQTIAGLAGLTKAAYFGPYDVHIRPFCSALLDAGLLYTELQINAMDNGQGLSVLRNCGGYNCMHEWLWVDENWKEVENILRRAA
jgi:hypothetical protein